jgi:hypothetical protein
VELHNHSPNTPSWRGAQLKAHVEPLIIVEFSVVKCKWNRWLYQTEFPETNSPMFECVIVAVERTSGLGRDVYSQKV